MGVEVEAETASGLLHDAFLELSSIKLDNESFCISGVQTLPVGLFRDGKYRVSLTVFGVTSFSIIDHAQVDQIDMDDIHVNADAIAIRGKMPVEIRLTVTAPRILGSREDRPFATRRFFRWRDETHRS